MCTHKIDTADAFVGWLLVASLVVILLASVVTTVGCGPQADPFVPVSAEFTGSAKVYSAGEGEAYDADACLEGVGLVYGVPARIEVCAVELNGSLCMVVSVEGAGFVGGGTVPQANGEVCEEAFGSFRTGPAPLDNAGE